VPPTHDSMVPRVKPCCGGEPPLRMTSSGADSPDCAYQVALTGISDAWSGSDGHARATSRLWQREQSLAWWLGCWSECSQAAAIQKTSFRSSLTPRPHRPMTSSQKPETANRRYRPRLPPQSPARLPSLRRRGRSRRPPRR